MTQAQTLQVILTLLFVLGLILTLAWLAKRSNLLRRHAKNIQLQILGTQSLGPRCSIAVVEIEGKRLVLGVTTQQITLLHNLTATESTATENFADTLDKTLTKT